MGTLLVDIFKAYDRLLQDLLKAKLQAYSLYKPSINLVNDYLSFRKQRTKIGSSYSGWANVARGIPLGSILGPLLFNIFINDILLFIEKSDLCNFFDDNTLFSGGDNLPVILKSQGHENMKILLRWFNLSSLKANPGKFQFMILGKSLWPKYCLTIGPISVKEPDHIELLGIIIDKYSIFKKLIENLCWNANYKLHALRRIKKYLTVEKAKILGNAFIDNQFN